MEKKEENPKILRNKYIPTAEFYSQIIDSLQDYSIFTLDKDFNINSQPRWFCAPDVRVSHNSIVGSASYHL